MTFRLAESLARRSKKRRKNIKWYVNRAITVGALERKSHQAVFTDKSRFYSKFSQGLSRDEVDFAFVDCSTNIASVKYQSLTLLIWIYANELERMLRDSWVRESGEGRRCVMSDDAKVVRQGQLKVKLTARQLKVFKGFVEIFYSE